MGTSIMPLSRRGFMAGLTAALIPHLGRAESSLVYSAEAFADSIGVNTHLTSAPYVSRFPQVCELVRDSGIRHLRDELRPTNDLARWRELFARFGVRSQMLVSPATNTVTQMLDYIAALGVEKISAIEGQNEGDSDWFMAHKAALGNWGSTVVAYQREVFEALRAKYSRDALPIVSPTVIDWKPRDIQLIKGAAEFCDIVAIHSYMQHAEEPETTAPFAALSWYLLNMRDGLKRGAPVMSTETGYNNLVQPGGSGVSETAAAIYLPRLLLHYYSSGVERTFLYELMDGGPDPKEWEAHWGLARHDGTPKPSFQAIAALIGAMRGGPGANSSATNTISAVLERPAAAVRLLQFGKADGSTILAVWRAVSCWNPAKAADIEVSPEPLKILLNGPITKAAQMTPNDGPEWKEFAIAGGAIGVPVGAKVVLLRLYS